MDKNDHTDMLDSGLNFAFPGVVKSSQSSIIKVIGVGGGGDNAVNYMYRQGIHDVSYVVCNTDQKAPINSCSETDWVQVIIPR